MFGVAQRSTWASMSICSRRGSIRRFPEIRPLSSSSARGDEAANPGRPKAWRSDSLFRRTRPAAASSPPCGHRVGVLPAGGGGGGELAGPPKRLWPCCRRQLLPPPPPPWSEDGRSGDCWLWLALGRWPLVPRAGSGPTWGCGPALTKGLLALAFSPGGRVVSILVQSSLLTSRPLPLNEGWRAVTEP